MYPCQATYFVLLRTFNMFTSYVQRVYFVRSTCLLRTFNGFFRAFKFLFRPFSLSYFGRSTCLLRPFNVFTSAVQRAYFGRSTVFFVRSTAFFVRSTVFFIRSMYIYKSGESFYKTHRFFNFCAFLSLQQRIYAIAFPIYYLKKIIGKPAAFPKKQLYIAFCYQGTASPKTMHAGCPTLISFSVFLSSPVSALRS